ncbi:hypothetical protein nbrc107696_20110 [Gordonia spumicola]|uniref:Uncharacterized protein n=1 Tax=Gordonia spumicola TaxID=589161 RepID=A0A7I9V856_9ACTN|nr:hypothetical protein nbrc107696_20110 [Gordonia spumicola]
MIEITFALNSRFREFIWREHRFISGCVPKNPARRKFVDGHKVDESRAESAAAVDRKERNQTPKCMRVSRDSIDRVWIVFTAEPKNSLVAHFENLHFKEFTNRNTIAN